MGTLTVAAGIAIAGAVTGLATVYNAEKTEEVNEDSMDFAAQQAEKNREFQQSSLTQQQQWQEEMYKKYQSPSAIIQQLKESGISPLGALGSLTGGNMPSSPSGLSGSQAAMPNLQVPRIDSDSVAKMINSISDSNLKDKQVIKMLAETKGQEIANAAADFDLYLTQKYADNEKVQRLKNLVSEGLVLESQGKLNDANSKVQEVMEMIAHRDLGIKEEEYSQLVIRGSYLAKLLDQEYALKKEEVKTEKSKQSVNYANAALSKVQKLGQEFQNSVLKIDSEIAAATSQHKLSALREEYMKNGSLSREQRLNADIEFEKLDKILKMYREHPNKAALDAALDNFNDKFPIVGGIIRALK